MKRYTLSKYVQIIKDEDAKCGQPGQIMVFHSLFGNPRLINEEGLKFLNVFQNHKTAKEVSKFCEGDPADIIEEFSNIFFLIDPCFDERKFLLEQRKQHLCQVGTGRTIDRMGLAISNACNFGCDHCLHFQTTGRSKTNLNMTWDTAKRCLDYYIDLMRKNENKMCKIHFGNAEPLINWEVIEKILRYSDDVKDMVFDFAINTNMSLITERIASILKKYNVRIAASLDGTSQANDAIRRTKNGDGTFNQIIEKFDLLAKSGYPLDGFSITVTDKNFDLVNTDILDLAAERGMTSIAFDYDLVGLLNVPIRQRVDKIMCLKKYANKRGIDFFGTWDSVFRNLTSESLISESFAFCAAVEGRSLEFDIDGSIKVCGHTKTQVGNIKETQQIFNHESGLINIVKDRFPGVDEYCFGCFIEGSCGGQCHATREVSGNIQAQHKNALFDDMCNFYREITMALAREYIKTNGLSVLGSQEMCTV